MIFFRSVEHMAVDVDQAGDDIHSLCRDNLTALFCIDVLRNQGDLVILYGDIHGCVNVVFRIDHVAAFYDNGVLLGRCNGYQKDKTG